MAEPSSGEIATILESCGSALLPTLEFTLPFPVQRAEAAVDHRSQPDVPFNVRDREGKKTDPTPARF
jgi:hypothetical protein